jgi:hypothetical protein
MNSDFCDLLQAFAKHELPLSTAHLPVQGAALAEVPVVRRFGVRSLSFRSFTTASKLVAWPCRI